MSWDDSLGNARVLDQWRQQIGLAYPAEKAPNFPAPLHRRPVRAKPGSPMTYGRIPELDKPISRLAMGLIGDVNTAAAVFDAYFESGGNCFDTSWWYGQGNIDKMLGRWMASRGVRDQTVVIAKGAHTPGCYPAELTRQLLQSLEFLQTDCADIYFMHRDNPDIPVGEFVEVLNEHHRAGRIKAFGGSNWSLARFKAFNEYAAKKGLKPMSALSNNFSLARMVNPVWTGCIASSTPEFRAWHRATKTPLFSWSSQARGFFVRGRPDFTADQELTTSWYSDDNFERKRRAEELARKHGVSAMNIALAYILAEPFPMFCLTGPQSLEEWWGILPGLQVKLTPDELRWVNLEEAQAAGG
jgi:aryl-alcohol dehydrogenase-like predicted oxidoreductase